MDPITGLMIVGTVMSIAGQMQQNQAEAEQEAMNAAYYLQQALYAKEAAIRQASVSTFDYAERISTQISRYTAGNVAMSGSATLTVGGTLSQMTKELWAIKRKGEMDYTLANMRAQGARERASQLNDPGFNLMQGLSIGINAVSRMPLKGSSGGGDLGYSASYSGNAPASGGPRSFYETAGRTA